MPYIPIEQRGIMSIPCTAGGLNYKITKLCLAYLAEKGESYQTYNDIAGVLTCAQLEMYRRQTAEYENEKCKLNGEVYPRGKKT